MIVKFLKEIVFSVVCALLVLALLFLFKSFDVVVPINPYPFGSMQWWGWAYFNY